jgi:hypothetical protein
MTRYYTSTASVLLYAELIVKMRKGGMAIVAGNGRLRATAATTGPETQRRSFSIHSFYCETGSKTATVYWFPQRAKEANAREESLVPAWNPVRQ